MSNFIIIETTTADRSQAETIARTLVEEKLAACVQITGPVSSVYRWRDKISSDQEYVCQAKTRAELFDRVHQKILELHSYEEPQIIALSIQQGSKGYLDWIWEQTQP